MASHFGAARVDVDWDIPTGEHIAKLRSRPPTKREDGAGEPLAEAGRVAPRLLDEFTPEGPDPQPAPLDLHLDLEWPRGSETRARGEAQTGDRGVS